MPGQPTVVTISVGKDSKNNDVTECTPHAVTLSKNDGDTIAWTSLLGKHSVTIQRCEGQPPPLLTEPFAGGSGQMSNSGQIARNAQPGHYVALATLTIPLPNGEEEVVGSGGAVIIIR
jgi:hypothetical protein